MIICAKQICRNSNECASIILVLVYAFLCKIDMINMHKYVNYMHKYLQKHMHKDAQSIHKYALICKICMNMHEYCATPF